MRQHCERAHLAGAAAAATAPPSPTWGDEKGEGKTSAPEGRCGASRVPLARSKGEVGLDAEISVTRLLANDFQPPQRASKNELKRYCFFFFDSFPLILFSFSFDVFDSKRYPACFEFVEFVPQFFDRFDLVFSRLEDYLSKTCTILEGETVRNIGYLLLSYK